MKRKSYKTLRLAAAVLFLVITVAAITGVPHFTWVLMIQPGPQWIRLAGEITVAGVVAVLTLLLATFLFGRLFCAVVCPFGTCQDILGLVRPNRTSSLPNLRALRYGIAAFSLLLLAGGWAVLFRFLDPFSRFAAMVGAAKSVVSADDGVLLSSGVVWSAVVPFVLLFLLVMWKRRVYCVALCPVGTVLGAVAKFSRWRLRFQKDCSECGRCDAICPTGCIDSAAKLIDAERCVLCLQCVSVCARGGVAYALAGSPTSRQRVDTAVAVDSSRRKFLLAGSVIVVGATALGRGFSRVFQGVARAADNVRGLILPPGAIDSERFARHCTGCQVCAATCPAKIIKPSPFGFGPVRLDFSENGCAYDCTRCNAACPSDALRPFNLVDKQWLRIGEAKVELPKCRIVKDGVACGMCAKACPKGAIFMTPGPDGVDVPEVAAFHCIGCGVCRAVCSVTPKAITVTAVEQLPMGF